MVLRIWSRSFSGICMTSNFTSLSYPIMLYLSSGYACLKSRANASTLSFSFSIYRNRRLAMILGTPGCLTIGGSSPPSPMTGATTVLSSGNLPSLPVIGLTAPLSSTREPSALVMVSIGTTPFTGEWWPQPFSSHDSNQINNIIRSSHNNHFKQPLPVHNPANHSHHLLYQGKVFSYWAKNTLSSSTRILFGDMFHPVNLYPLLGVTIGISPLDKVVLAAFLNEDEPSIEPCSPASKRQL